METSAESPYTKEIIVEKLREYRDNTDRFSREMPKTEIHGKLEYRVQQTWFSNIVMFLQFINLDTLPEGLGQLIHDFSNYCRSPQITCRWKTEIDIILAELVITLVIDEHALTSENVALAKSILDSMFLPNIERMVTFLNSHLGFNTSGFDYLAPQVDQELIQRAREIIPPWN
ncbi:hypothetical protein ACFLY9_00955 [Patescibacteria group bacterium]